MRDVLVAALSHLAAMHLGGLVIRGADRTNVATRMDAAVCADQVGDWIAGVAERQIDVPTPRVPSVERSARQVDAARPIDARSAPAGSGRGCPGRWGVQIR